MRFDLLTIFPSLFGSIFEESILKKAIDGGIISVGVHDIREFAKGRHRVTDDIPFGGGPGMVMKPEPIFMAVESVKDRYGEGKVVLLSPSGKLFNSVMAKDFASSGHLILICGRYEGVDQRVSDYLADCEVSIGDYVLTGGEIPAMAVVDAVSRFVPGVVGRQESVKKDSFEEGFLEGPHYTRPQNFREMVVPPVLVSGDHGKIEKFRKKEGLKKTLNLRPDLLSGKSPGGELEKLLREIEDEKKRKE